MPTGISGSLYPEEHDDQNRYSHDDRFLSILSIVKKLGTIDFSQT